jgi:hypothetical protein
MTTVRVLLSVAINNEWVMSQMDIKNAFMHEDLEEEVFMKLPPGHPQGGHPQGIDFIALLKKNLQLQFPIKDLGHLKYFHGIEMTTSSKGLFLNQ